MTVLAFRVQNFMGFVDSGWIDLPSICLLFGCNSSGKSALVKALRMLKQSLDSNAEQGPLVLSAEDGVDLGTYWDVVHTHDISADMKFSFRCALDPQALVDFRSAQRRREARLNDEPELPVHEAVAEIELGFGLPDINSRQIILRGIAIKVLWGTPDEYPLIFLTEREDAVYGWRFESDVLTEHLMPFVDPIWRYVTPDTNRSGFLPLLRDPGGEYSRDSEEFARIQNLLHEFQKSIAPFLDSVIYVGPLRNEPQRFYYVPASSAQGASSYGMSAIQKYLLFWGKPEWKAIEAEVNRCFQDLGLNISLVPTPLLSGRESHEPMFEIQITEDGQPHTKINVSDVGFGVSQILPVVLYLILPSDGGTVLVEQPELHLHPGASTALGDLFTRAANRGSRFLIETHSEHLLLRIRRRIAETTAGVLSSDDERSLTQDKVNVSFVERKLGQSLVTRIELGALGDLEQLPDKGFFSDDYREVSALTEAALRAKKAKVRSAL